MHHRESSTDRCSSNQDEYKRLEDSEKKSRERLGAKTEQILWDIEAVIEQRENPESQKWNMEMDELWVNLNKTYP